MMVEQILPRSKRHAATALTIFYATNSVLYLVFFWIIGLTDPLIVGYGTILWPSLFNGQTIQLVFIVVGVAATLVYLHGGSLRDGLNEVEFRD